MPNHEPSKFSTACFDGFQTNEVKFAHDREILNAVLKFDLLLLWVVSSMHRTHLCLLEYINFICIEDNHIIYVNICTYLALGDLVIVGLIGKDNLFSFLKGLRSTF